MLWRLWSDLSLLTCLFGRIASAGSRKQWSQRSYVNKVGYLRNKVNMLKEEVKELTQARASEKRGRTSSSFICKVALSKPSTSARAYLSQNFEDLVGNAGDVVGCSRSAIEKIRDAFVSVAVDVSLAHVRDMVLTASCAGRLAAASGAGSSAAASRAGVRPFQVAVLHIHDEASLRLRSRSDTLSHLPERSRSSKVQQHLVWLYMESRERVRFPTELHALSNKSAAVLATSLDLILRDVLGQVTKGLSGAAVGEQPWVVHVLVGDGVATNFAAARTLWARCKSQGHPARGVLYFLMVVKCSSHQANLSIGCAVSGRAAAVGSKTQQLFALVLQFSSAGPRLAKKTPPARTTKCAASLCACTSTW